MSDNQLLAHKLGIVGDEVKELRGEFKSHMKDHQRVDLDMKAHGEDIAAMKAIMPDLQTTLKEVVKTTQTLNSTMIRIDEQTQANTQFRYKFTWKEVFVVGVAVVTILQTVGQYWGGN